MQLGGDWYDMPSLSKYDKPGSHSTEGRRIHKDRDAGYKALEVFFGEMYRLGYEPPSVWICEGNHEERLDRYLEDDPKLDGIINREQFFRWSDFGIKSAPFMAPMRKDGVTYCHLFDVGPNGQTTGSRSGQPTAKQQIARVAGSSVAGHRQGFDHKLHWHPYATKAKQQTFAVIAGSFYLDKHKYRGPTDGFEARGIVILDYLNGHGRGIPKFVPIDILEESYG